MLKEIFNQILPDNIKEIQLVQDAIDIFIENVEENSPVSKDVRNIFLSDNDIVRESLLNVYLNALYDVIIKAQGNSQLIEKINSTRTGALINQDIKNILNDEYFITNKTYKQKKGLRESLKYSYNLAKRLEGIRDIEDQFRLYELKPFHFKIEGSILKETYENIVKPLSHPLGFTYVYSHIISKSISDLFGIKYIYDVHKLEIRCLTGFIDVFTSDPNDVNVKAEFLTRTNILTGELFTEAEYAAQVRVFTNKFINEFTVFSDENGTHTGILFTDGTFLEQYQNPQKIYYRYYQDELEHNDNYIKVYSESCSMYVEYTRTYDFTYYDEMSFEEISSLSDSNLTITNINETLTFDRQATATNYLSASETTPGESGTITPIIYSDIITFTFGDIADVGGGVLYAQINEYSDCLGIEPGVTVGWETYWQLYTPGTTNLGWYLASDESGTYFYTT